MDIKPKLTLIKREDSALEFSKSMTLDVKLTLTSDSEENCEKLATTINDLLDQDEFKLELLKYANTLIPKFISKRINNV